MESHLPAFKEKNPQLELVTELIRGQHPHLKGLYGETLFLSLPLILPLLHRHICSFLIALQDIQFKVFNEFLIFSNA